MEHHLIIGAKDTGAAVVPDDRWPGMWRVRTPDGRVSDMVNLTRAKDATPAWAGRQGFINVRRDARWVAIETVLGAGSMRPAPGEAPP